MSGFENVSNFTTSEAPQSDPAFNPAVLLSQDKLSAPQLPKFANSAPVSQYGATFTPNGVIDQFDPTTSGRNGPDKNGGRQLSLQGQEAVNKTLGFDAGKAGGRSIADMFEYGEGKGLPASIGSLGFSRPALKDGVAGFGPKDPIATWGKAETYLDSSKLGAFAQQFGFGTTADPKDSTRSREMLAAQEVLHRAVLSHPDIMGRIKPAQNEVLGNTASLNVDPAFTAVNVQNALMFFNRADDKTLPTEQRSAAQKYVGIAVMQMKSFDDVGKEMKMKGSGQEILKRYFDSINKDESKVNNDSLRAFASSEGVDPTKFISALQNATVTNMNAESNSIISNIQNLQAPKDQITR